jgi:hypothetical protein
LIGIAGELILTIQNRDRNGFRWLVHAGGVRIVPEL